PAGRARLPLGGPRAPGARGRPRHPGAGRRLRALLGHAPARCARGGRGQPAIAAARLARRAAGARGRCRAAARHRRPAPAAVGRLSRVGGARRAVGRPARARPRSRALDPHARARGRRLCGRPVARHAADAVSLAIAERVPLAPLTTLGVGGDARWFVEATDEAAVRAAYAWARERSVALRVLGGGSNLVVADAGVDA